MPRFEIDIDEKGEFIGQLPAEIESILKRIEITAHGTGFRGGQSKAAEEAKQKLEDAIKAERTRLEAEMPLEREKMKAVEEENKTLKAHLTDTMRESNRNLTKREEAHAEEITKRVEALNKRDAKILELVKGEIRAEALQAGVRDDALHVVAEAIGTRVLFDDDMNVVIKGDDGQPMMVHGKPQTLPGHVRTFLEQNAYFRKPTPGKGGDARRGVSLSGGHHGVPSVETAGQRVADGDRSPDAINDLFMATRKKTA